MPVWWLLGVVLDLPGRMSGAVLSLMVGVPGQPCWGGFARFFGESWFFLAGCGDVVGAMLRV